MSDALANLLIVDDNEENLLILASDLTYFGYAVNKAQNGKDALNLVLENQYDLIILDVEMPDMNGYELFSAIREVGSYEDVPVLFLSANRVQRQDVIEGLKRGAFDYIIKPYDAEELRCRIDLLVELYKRGRELIDKNISLTELAIKDPLTNLYNRRFGMESLKREMNCHARYGGSICLLMIDLDDFKSINDKYGHNQGDLVLKFVSKLLLDSIRDTDTCFRSGGDEFVIVLPSCDQMACENICKRILNAKNTLSGQTLAIDIGLSIGGAIFSEPQNDENYMKELADIALINAKSAGKNRFKILQEEESVEQTEKGVLKLSEVRTSVKLVLTNVLNSVLNEFEIKGDTVGGHTDLMLNLLDHFCDTLEIKKHNKVKLLNAVKLRRLEHLGVSKELLNKKDPLNDEQKGVLSEALIENIEKLTQTSFFDDEAEILLTHHEYVNGTGYPNGLKEEDIPLEGKLLAIIEAYALLVLGGPYTPSYGFQKAIKILRKENKGHFSKLLIDQLDLFISSEYLPNIPAIKHKILIVDDKKEITDLITNFLKNYRIDQVVVSDSKEKALQILEKETISLIVTDISMPGTNKLSLLDDYLKLTKAKVPIIVISSGYSKLAWEQKEKYHIFAAFRKPISLFDLYQQVLKGLDAIKE